MANNNNQAQQLIDEYKAANAKAKDYIDGLNRKIAELDLEYARLLVQNNINVMKAAKSVLQSKK